MKLWMFALIAMFGCTAETPKPVEAKASAESPVSAPISTPPTSPMVESASGEKGADAVAEDQNPNRINQLRDLKRVKIQLPKKTVEAWIADNDSKRQEGMMFLTNAEVKDTEGMLFVFPNESERGFWMQNTYLALDIIYIAKDGTVVSIAKGKPRDESTLPSNGPAMYVLELKSGKAAEFGVTKGLKLKLPPVRAVE